VNPSHPIEDRPFDDPALEREWRAQEDALRAERGQADPVHDDARRRSYRAVARVLREPLPDALPADFAAQLARHVMAEESADSAFATPFERITLGFMVALFGIAIGVAVAVSASATLQPVGDALHLIVSRGSNRWLVALGACLAVSSAMQRWTRSLAVRAKLTR